MGITTVGLSVIASNMTGSALPTHIAIGTSGTAFASGNTALAVEVERNAYSSSDLATTEEVTFVADWSPVEVSGLEIREHGTFTIGSAMLNREVIGGSLVMTGEEELQVQQTFKFFN